MFKLRRRQGYPSRTCAVIGARKAQCGCGAKTGRPMVRAVMRRMPRNSTRHRRGCILACARDRPNCARLGTLCRTRLDRTNARSHLRMAGATQMKPDQPLAISVKQATRWGVIDARLARFTEALMREEVADHAGVYGHRADRLRFVYGVAHTRTSVPTESSTSPGEGETEGPRRGGYGETPENQRETRRESARLRRYAKGS